MDRNYLQSRKWKHWLTVDDPKRCVLCKEQHGKIYHITEIPNPKPPLHFFCRCRIAPMNALKQLRQYPNPFWVRVFTPLHC